MSRSANRIPPRLLGLCAFSLALGLGAEQARACNLTDPSWSNRDDDGDGVCNGVDDCPYEVDPAQTKEPDGTGVACQMQAITVPWIPTATSLPHETYTGATITLKGITRYGSPTSFYWDFGDGTNTGWQTITNTYDLSVQHAYIGNVNQLFIATLSVKNAAGTVATATYPIQVLLSSDTTVSTQMDVRISIAEDEALWRIHLNEARAQYADGSPGYYQHYGYWSEGLEATCASLDALQLHGSKPTSSYDADPYVEDVKSGLAYLLGSSSYTLSIGVDSDGNQSDLIGDGIGVDFDDNAGGEVYTDGICGVAFASSSAPGFVSMTGPNNYTFNQTYGQIMQRVVDWFAWSQNDDSAGVYAGGWYYTANQSEADGSTNQWPIMVMVAASDNMGTTIPGEQAGGTHFVKARIPTFLNYIHDTNTADPYYGGYGYTSATLYPNVAKTAGGILANFFIGNGNTSSAVEEGLGLIYNRWSVGINGWVDYNLGDSYAMYDVMKAMEKANPKITRIPQLDASTGLQTGTSFDWYYTPSGQQQTGLATDILSRQSSDGSFNDVGGTAQDLGTELVTAWDTLILLKAVTLVPPQAVICNCTAQWPANSPVTLDGSCSIEPDVERAIVAYNWDYYYNGSTFVQSTDSDGLLVEGPQVTKPDGFPTYTELADGGPTSPPVAWPVALEVVDNNPTSQGGPQTSITVCDVVIKPPPHCPQADIGGPYLGTAGKPVQLDASGSTQVDGDPLTYAWDFNNANLFNSSTLVDPTVTFNADGTYPIELEVTNHPSQDAGAVPSCTVTAYTTVIIGNHAPVANAGGPYTGVPGTVVQLQGSGSYDPDGDVDTYAWDLTGNGLYNDSTLLNPTFTVPSNAVIGTAYAVCIKVSDPYGLSSINCNTVTAIENPAPPNCIIAPTAVDSCTGGALTTSVDGTHSYDPNGEHFTYAWSSAPVLDGGPDAGAPEAACPPFDSPDAGISKLTFNTAAEGCAPACTATLTLTNKYGSSSCSQKITITDGLSPAFTLTPQSLTVECNANAAATVNAWLANAGATEACVSPAAPVTLTNSFIGGAGCGGLGGQGTVDNTQTVTWTAVDPCNNNIAQASATLTVSDTQPPVLTIPTSTITVEAVEPAGAPVSFAASALDAATGPAPISCLPASGSTFAIGTTTVTCTSSDPLGHVATGQFNVTVRDTTPPTLTLSPNLVVEATGPGGATVNFTGSATDIVDVTDAVTCLPASGQIFALGVTEVICSSTDKHNNTATGTFSITVRDTTPPILSVPANLTVEATSAAGATVTYTATAVDLVSGNTAVTCIPASGNTFVIGTTQVTCSSSDAHGNSASSQFNITVRDTTAPVITVPSNLTVEATSAAGATVTYTATAYDTVDGSTAVSCAPASGSTFALGTAHVSCSSTDKHGNSATNGFNVTVQDTTPPTVTVPSNLTVEATGPSGAQVSFASTATDIVDGSTSVSCAPASGSTFVIGTTQVTCSSTDKHGNTGHNSFEITVQDTTGPVLTLPSNMTVEATGPTGAPATFVATAKDVVSGNTSVTCTPASGSTFALGDTPVTCRTVDQHGNSTSGTFDITVQDTTAPTLTVPANLLVEATGPSGAIVNFTATASDAVSGNTLVTCAPASGTRFAMGVTAVSCSSTDAAGNVANKGFTVTVRDTTPPVLTVPANLVVEATSSSGAPVTFVATASDVVSGSTAVLCVPASGNTFVIGTTQVTCTSSDAAGNSASGKFNVTVQDTTPPVITVPSNLTVEATGPGGAPVTFAATATDLVSGNTAVTCVPASGNTFVIGTTVVTCTSSDSRGNSASSHFSVLVQDTTPPVLTVPANLVVEANGNSGSPVSFVATALDAVSGNTPVICTPASGTIFAIGTTTVTCTSTDQHGNTGTASFTVRVGDAIPPVITVPSNLVGEATGPSGAILYYTVSALDAVDGVRPVNCTPASGSLFALGQTTVTCTSSDLSGNLATANFVATVRDTTPPVITGIADNSTITLEATGPSGASMASYGLTASDLVDGTTDVVCSPAAPATFPLGQTTVSCTSTDRHGNVGSLAFHVSVLDTTPPVITCPANLTVMSNGPLGAFNWNVAEPTSDALEAFVATAVDLVDPSPVVSSNAPAMFPTGETTSVTFTATDAHQNSASCSASVTVVKEQATPPALTCPANTVLSSGNGMEIDWNVIFDHPVSVQLLVVNGSAGGGLSLADLANQAVQLNSSPTASGGYAVRIRAVDQMTGFAVDCNRFLSVSPALQPAERTQHVASKSVPAAPIY